MANAAVFVVGEPATYLIIGGGYASQPAIATV